PHPGLPDQGGIVLALAQQDVHDARDLGVATAHRLQVAAPGLRGEIHRHALEHLSRLEQPFERIAHSGQAAPRNRRYQSYIAGPNTKATAAPMASNTPNGT